MLYVDNKFINYHYLLLFLVAEFSASNFSCSFHTVVAADPPDACGRLSSEWRILLLISFPREMEIILNKT